MDNATFKTMKPLEQYKDMGQWCKDFVKENNRKATFDDFFAFKNWWQFEWKIEMPSNIKQL